MLLLEVFHKCILNSVLHLTSSLVALQVVMNIELPFSCISLCHRLLYIPIFASLSSFSWRSSHIIFTNCIFVVIIISHYWST